MSANNHGSKPKLLAHSYNAATASSSVIDSSEYDEKSGIVCKKNYCFNFS